MNIELSDIKNILVGLILSFLGWLVPFIYERFRRWRELRIVSRVFPTVSKTRQVATVHVRASLDRMPFGNFPATLRGYTHIGDVRSIVALQDLFDDLPVKLKFDYFDEISKDFQNLIVLGISERSDVSREIAEMLKDRGYLVEGYQEHASFKDSEGNTYRCEHKELDDGVSVVSKDSGIIVRWENDQGQKILLCGGLHTSGTYAATLVASQREFQKKVKRSKLKRFIQFVSVNTITDGEKKGLGIDANSLQWRSLPLEEISE